MICNLTHWHEIVDMIHVRRDVRQQRMRQNSLTIKKKYMKFSIAIYLLFTMYYVYNIETPCSCRYFKYRDLK